MYICVYIYIFVCRDTQKETLGAQTLQILKLFYHFHAEGFLASGSDSVNVDIWNVDYAEAGIL